MARNKRSLSVGDMEPVEAIDFFGNSFETPFEANDKKTLDELEEYEMQYIPLDKIVDNKKNEYPIRPQKKWRSSGIYLVSRGVTANQCHKRSR